MPRSPDEYLITRPEQLEALASPVRHQLHLGLEMLGPCSVTDLATWMGRQPETLYYHIRKLESVGLVIADGERGHGPQREVLYRLPAPRIRVDVANRSPRFLRAIAKGAGAMLRHAERCFARGIVEDSPNAQGPARRLRLEQDTIRLSDKSMRELNRRLDDLQAFLREADRPGAAGVNITLLVAPNPCDPDSD